VCGNGGGGGGDRIEIPARKNRSARPDTRHAAGRRPWACVVPTPEGPPWSRQGPGRYGTPVDPVEVVCDRRASYRQNVNWNVTVRGTIASPGPPLTLTRRTTARAKLNHYSPHPHPRPHVATAKRRSVQFALPSVLCSDVFSVFFCFSLLVFGFLVFFV